MSFAIIFPFIVTAVQTNRMKSFIILTKASNTKKIVFKSTDRTLKIIVGKVYFRKHGAKRVIFNVLLLLYTPGCFL